MSPSGAELFVVFLPGWALCGEHRCWSWTPFSGLYPSISLSLWPALVMYASLLSPTPDHWILHDCWFSLSPSVPFPGVAVIQSLSHAKFFATPWTVALQASLSFTISWSLLKLMSTESVIPSNYLILCHALLLVPSIFPSIGVFSNQSALQIRWPKY